MVDKMTIKELIEMLEPHKENLNELIVHAEKKLLTDLGQPSTIEITTHNGVPVLVCYE